MAHTISGAAITPTAQTSNSTQTRTLATLSTSAWVASCPSRAWVAASTGMKAWLNAPSANMRRNKLGIRNATLKASVMALAPKVAASKVSRTRPVTRESSVHKETVEAERRRFTPRV